MNDIEICYKFENLFEILDKEKYPEVDTVIMTGGRYSLKSYTVAILSLVALVEYGYSCLYTRYTNLSIIDSIKPEVSEKIDLLGYGGLVNDTNSHIECALYHYFHSLRRCQHRIYLRMHQPYRRLFQYHRTL